MSNNEVPQQGGPANDFDEFEMPPVPARWDDPPSMLGKDDLARMAPGRNDDDPLLAGVSDDLWAPVELNEAPEVDAARLASIIEGGAQLRERWAETAALEEAYSAPPADAVPTQVRMRKARIDKIRQAQARRAREHRRVRRSMRISGVVGMSLGATVYFALSSGNELTASIMANLVVISALCAQSFMRIGTTTSLPRWVRSVLRRVQRLGAVMKKPE